MTTIDSFSGDYSFLSNFDSGADIRVSTTFSTHMYFSDSLIIKFPMKTVEHGFQAAKAKDVDTFFEVLACETPGQAKAKGRKLELRPDWDTKKEAIMMLLLLQKFSFKLNPDYAKNLVATGDRKLVEGNTWGDTYWGVCNGQGLNLLGTTLTTIRGMQKAMMKS
jgi:ribA/ribD-fused uncharacterized protein